MRAIIFLCLTLFSSTSYSAPLYYTFNGTITSINDEAGLAEEADITVGTNFSLTLLVDFDSPGTVTILSNIPFLNQYITSEMKNYQLPNGVSIVYFYTDLTTKQLIQGSYLGDMGTSESNYGYEQIDTGLGLNTLRLYGSNSPNTTGDDIILETQYVDLTEISVGKTFNFYEDALKYINGKTYRTEIFAIGTTQLVNISQVLPPDVNLDGDVDGEDLHAQAVSFERQMGTTQVLESFSQQFGL